MEYPEKLDNTKLHSPAEVAEYNRQYQMAARHEHTTRRLIEQSVAKENAQKNKTLSADEYYQIALEREAEKQVKAQALIDSQAAAFKQKEEYLSSSENIVEICETNPASLCVALNHWVGKRGYTIDINCIEHFQQNIYVLHLIAPIAVKKAIK